MRNRRLPATRPSLAPKLPGARSRLLLEQLEDRTTPATLDIAPVGLVNYSAGVGVANALPISTDGTNYPLPATAETITLTPAAVTAGWSGSGTNSVTGPNA